VMRRRHHRQAISGLLVKTNVDAGSSAEYLDAPKGHALREARAERLCAGLLAAEGRGALNGTTVRVRLARARLCHSPMMFVRTYPRKTQEMVFDAHDPAFAFFRGRVHARYLRQHEDAVETTFIGKQRQHDRRFLQMCSHCPVKPVDCTPGSGWRRERSRIRSVWLENAFLRRSTLRPMTS
jgi:hypothetical protein